MASGRLNNNLVLWLVLLAAAVPAAAEHIPSSPSGVVEIEGRAAVILNTRLFDPLVEAVGRFEDQDLEFRYRSLTAGSYVRLHRNLKAGLFYRLQAGARHDDDWIDLSPGWEWVDSRSRLEHVLIFDLSPRVRLAFLPGTNWVFMLKSRYLLNTYNLEQSVLLRPGLTYHWMVDREPLFSFSLNYGLYFPLNFGSTVIYEQAPYLSVLYHLSPSIKLELTGSYRSVVWSSSEDSLAAGDSYQVASRAFGVGFGVLYVLRP
jgi:hypothetical protein